MRSKKAVRNFVVSLSFQIVMMICGLVFPRWIILTYGSTINGLTQTINQVINYLNLLRAGAIGASVYTLYKPVAENDYETINKVLFSTKKYFIRIGTIFTLAVIILSPILAYLKSGEGLSFFDVVISVAILGVNASFSFFFYSWYDTLFQSYQEQYLFTIAQLAERIVYYSLLCIILFCKLPFICMYVALVFGGVCRIIVLNVFYRRTHAMHINKRANSGTITVQNKGSLFVNQIAIQMVDGAPVLIFSFAFGLKYASVFSVYYMIYGILKTIISIAYTSCNTSFANYVVTNHDEDIKILFGFIQYAFFVLGMWVVFCCGSLYLEFIKLYTLNISDIDYFIPSWALAAVVYIVSYTLYIPYYMLTNTYGFFKQMVKPAVSLAIISILFSLALGKFINSCFVICGPAFYYIGMGIFRGIVSKKHIRWFSFNNLIPRIIFTLFMLVMSYVSSNIILTIIHSWCGWILAAICVVAIGFIFLFVYSIIFERQNIGLFRYYVNSIILRKKENKND